QAHTYRLLPYTTLFRSAKSQQSHGYDKSSEFSTSARHTAPTRPPASSPPSCESDPSGVGRLPYTVPGRSPSTAFRTRRTTGSGTASRRRPEHVRGTATDRAYPHLGITGRQPHRLAPP